MMNCWESLRSFKCLCGRESITVGNKKFVIRENLGEGGFAIISLIEERQTRKLFALKKITCHSTDDEKEALKEANYMRELRHQNLVPSEGHALLPSKNNTNANFGNHSSDVINDVLIIMPYYERGSLADALHNLRMSSSCMEESRISDLLYGVSLGLQYLHNYRPINIAHRDVKPHNVMFYINESLREVPVLVDFGSMGAAKCVISNSIEARRLQDFAAEKCSMTYRAPELFQVEIGTITESVDIWSLGCTLYAMCFHESPFDGVHQRGDSVALAVMAEKIKLPGHHKYSVFLIEVMMMMLRIKPQNRISIDYIVQEMLNHRQGIRML